MLKKIIIDGVSFYLCVIFVRKLDVFFENEFGEKLYFNENYNKDGFFKLYFIIVFIIKVGCVCCNEWNNFFKYIKKKLINLLSVFIGIFSMGVFLYIFLGLYK